MGQNYNRGELSIISCESGRHFAEKVVKRLDEIVKCEEAKYGDNNLGVDLTKSKEERFANTEIKTEIGESIRGNDVYIFQDVANHSDGMSINDNVCALKTAIDAARRADAPYITAVIPVFPYARQDKAKSREGITAASFARDIEDLGASRVITLDIHNTAIAGFFRKAVLENLRASRELISYIKNSIGTYNMIVVAADAGGGKRAEYFAENLGTELAFMYKTRNYSVPNQVERTVLLGNVKDKHVLVVEDMIDTAGTLNTASLTLHDEGASKIFLAASLTMLNGKANERLDALHKEGIVNKVIGTNVIYKQNDFSELHPWYDDVKLENYFARVIYNINKGISISKLLE